MQFAQPLWLLAGAATCAFLLWRYRRFQTQQRAILARFAAVRLLNRLTASVSPTRRKAKQALFVLGVACLFVALARPQAGYEWQETHRKGIEVLFAVDTSKSMLTQDVKPDRLSRAKLAVHDFVDKLNGDSVGLIAFAGNAFLQCPVTLDYDAFRESLDALDTKVIPRGGTDIAAAIREAEAVFKTRATAEKILVLVTDGEDLGGEGIAAAKEAAKNGVKIFAVGVGSTTGDLVPVPNENGGTDFVRDASGQLVKSHLDEATLKQIAEATGGMYQPLGQQGEGLSAIYDQGLGSFIRHDLSTRQAKVYLEQFQWALLAALVCFIAEMLIGTRRKVRKAKTDQAPVRAKPAWADRHATAMLGIALLGATATTRAALPQAAEQAYKRGDFTKSQSEYTAAAAKEPAKTVLQFNAGSAAYKAGNLARAATDFQNSLHTEEVPVQQGAFYNLGNTQFRLGQKTEKSNPKETIETWGEAVRSYDAALQIEPGDVQAKHNRDLVKRKIEQLKKQEDQKKQQQQQQSQKNDSKDQKSNPENQQAGQNGQEPKDQQQPRQDQKNGSKDQKSDPKDQKAGQNGQEPKDQQQPRQDEKNGSEDQKSDPKDQKGDPKNQQPGQNGQEPKDQKQQDQAQNGRPEPVKSEPQKLTGKKPSQGQPQAANGQQPEPGDPVSAGGERREPGQMTKEEAQQLLDALKNDERKLPPMSMQGRTAGRPDDQQEPLKDW